MGEQHALKHSLLLAAIGNDQRASEFLFDREARLLKDLGGLDGVPQFVARPSDEALVCHWIDGQTLAELKSRGGAGAVWTHQDVAHLGGRLATVLSHIAERLPGFVHNDLAPRNIMLPGGRPEEAVLIDLGLAAHSAHSMMTIVDELDLDLRATYQAPEVRDGEVGTARSDMYSLGLLLLEMLLPGELPPAVPSAVQDALRRTRLSSGSAASQRLADVLGRLLNQIANHRPKSWHEVSYDMSKVLNG